MNRLVIFYTNIDTILKNFSNAIMQVIYEDHFDKC